MIIDKIENAHLYYSISSDVEECLKYLESKAYPTEVTARYKVGEKTSFNVSKYISNDPAKREWEAHEHCLDLQFVISGTESIYYANRSQMTYTGKEEGKDHLCYEGEGSMLKLQAGYFCILFPDDVHKTKTLWQNPCEILKGVFKIKI